MSAIPLAILFSLLILAATLLLNRCRHDRKLPPGPLGLPIIGHLHMLGQLPHQALHHLAQKHGPIMYIRLGLKPTIVVSSPHLAELFLKTHDVNFASRPKTETTERLAYGSKGMAFSEYGPYCRSMRRLCTLELLSPAKIEEFAGMRRDVVSQMVGRLRAAAGAVVDVSDEVALMVEDMTCRMLFGNRFDEGGFDVKGAVMETVELVGAFNVSDFLPFLAPLDIQNIGFHTTSKGNQQNYRPHIGEYYQ